MNNDDVIQHMIQYVEDVEQEARDEYMRNKKINKKNAVVNKIIQELTKVVENENQ